MNKTGKGSIAGGIALGVLSGTLILLNVTKPDPEPNESVSSVDSTTTVLWSHDNLEVDHVDITYGDDAYTIVRTDQITSADDGSDVANFTVKGYETLPINTTLIRTVATRIGTVTAQKTVEENPSDLSRYGLDKPQAVAVGYLEDGTVLRVEVGDVSPLGTEQYVLIDGTVYTLLTSAVSPFLMPTTGYLDCMITAAQAEGDETIVEKVTIDREDIDFDIVVEYDKFYAEQESGGTTASHIMTSPTPCNVNVEKSAAITHGMYGLTASKVYVGHPSEADITKTGLDKPFCTVTVETSDNKTQKMTFGKSFEGEDGVTYYYGMYDGVDAIYEFTADQAAWVTVQPVDIAAKLIVITYVWDIGTLTVEADGYETMHFEGMGSNKEDYIVTLNGEEILTERFRQFYAFLLKTSGEDLLINEPVPTTKKLASIKLTRQDGLKEQTVEFYEAEGRKCYIVVDGVCAFRCRRTYVDTLLKNMALFHTAEDFVLTW